MVVVMVVVVLLMLPVPVLLLVLLVPLVVVVVVLLLLQLLLHCPPPPPPPQVWCQYGQNMWRTCVLPYAPSSQVPCPPFRTFTRHLHHHLSGGLPVRGKLTS